MPTRRTLLISGASTIITALLSPRAMAAQRRLKPLKPGSRIRAVNPGTWMDPDTDLQALRERCDQQQWHLEIPAAVTRQWRYFSGTDQERVEDLRSAWNDPTVDAVVTLGGGWGPPAYSNPVFVFRAIPNGAWGSPTPAPCCWPSGPLACRGPSWCWKTWAKRPTGLIGC